MRNGHKGDCYIGCSLGILMTSYARDEIFNTLPKNVYNREITAYSITDLIICPPAFSLP